MTPIPASRHPSPSEPATALRSAVRRLAPGCAVLLAVLAAGCRTTHQPGKPLPRSGDEIVVCGQLFHTGTRVVTWMDPGGYDAYRVEKRFAPMETSDWKSIAAAPQPLASPNRYDLRKKALTTNQIERFRGGGWELPALQEAVDQFVLHFDVSGTSRQCFKVLHDQRCLSVHFMLDLDGTIYQTLDLKERAWHATTSNTRSIGIEIANIGAYPLNNRKPLDEWYRLDAQGHPFIQVPARLGPQDFQPPGFIPRPARSEPVIGPVQGQDLVQYDFTPEQYRALAHLTATLCKVFPKMLCDYPRNAGGCLIRQKLPDDQLERFQGILGHYHVQSNKVDPGPAMNWEGLMDDTRRLMR